MGKSVLIDPIIKQLDDLAHDLLFENSPDMLVHLMNHVIRKAKSLRTTGCAYDAMNTLEREYPELHKALSKALGNYVRIDLSYYESPYQIIRMYVQQIGYELAPSGTYIVLRGTLDNGHDKFYIPARMFPKCKIKKSRVKKDRLEAMRKELPPVTEPFWIDIVTND